MSNGNGHRWSKFWWRDHQGDAALRMCSLGARGLWIELLCIAHEADPVGHVLVNGRQPTPRQLASIIGANPQEVTRYLRELEEAGVFSRTPEGAICSRRMCRDAAQSQVGREAISKRWSNKPNQSNGGDPNRSPNRSPDRDPTPDPNTRSLEAESEAEEDPPRRSPPSGDATPQSRDPGNARRVNGTNPRAEGTSPRQEGTNPRALAANPRANGTNPRKPFRSGALELIRREMEERDSAPPWLNIGAIGHVH